MPCTETPTAWIPLSDGTRLAARLWRPAHHDAPVPAVLEYLPYRRRDATAQRDATVYPVLATLGQGYAGVRVDLRGTGDSDGLFDDEYSEQELSDAEEVIAWIASQPWCNGRVAMMGISWGGFNALQVAARRPPALKSVVSIASTVDRFADDIHYKGGAQLSAQVYWATQMLGRNARPPDAAVLGAAWRDTWTTRLDATQPLIEPWLSHQRRDAYWRHGSICEDFSAIEADCLVIAGWADGYRNTPWKAMLGLGDKCRAITGPWVHAYPHFARPRPGLDFLHVVNQAWLEPLHLSSAFVERPPAHRLWRSEAVRPDGDRTRDPGQWVAIDGPGKLQKVFYLAQGGLSAVPGPDTPVTVDTPQDCGAEAGEYFATDIGATLPRDQRPDDGLSVCFDTAPLEVDLDVIGVPVLRVPVTLDRPQGMLVARLVDVHPDGAAHRVSLGVLNLSHRGGSAAPEPMEPGRTEDITLELDVAAYRFKAGHRLRLALSTTYFPYVLPPPVRAAATLRLGAKARLHLPDAATRPVDVPQAEAALAPFPRLSPAAESRETRRDMGTLRTTTEHSSDTGRLRHPDNGIEWREWRHSLWSIQRDDPLSLQGRERYMASRWREGIHTHVIAEGDITASATQWHVTSNLTAQENGRTIWSKRWTWAIARDLM